MPARMLRRLALLTTLLVLLAACHAPVSRSASPQPPDRPYVVLVSLDGFRWDFDRLADTPALDRMARTGLKAEALQPVFPTLTFPNHYSIATGLLPHHHGIVANTFPDASRERWYRMQDRDAVQDGRWYAGEPLWVTAERQGMRTAAFYFVGTEADVGGVRPSHWRLYDEEVPGEARVQQVLRWLNAPAERRPHFITLYFEDVDTQTHRHGVGSTGSVAAIERVDRLLAGLQEGIEALPFADEVYLIVVSDHGTAAHRPVEPLVLDRLVDLRDTRIVEGGSYAFLYFERDRTARARSVGDAINAAWDCGRAALPAELPPAWRVGDNPRWPDLIVQADSGCAVLSSEDQRRRLNAADHGWPPDAPEMQGILYATGPRLPPGTRVGPVHVTDIQPLIIELLGLEPPGPVDGDPARLPSLLQAESR